MRHDANSRVNMFIHSVRPAMVSGGISCRLRCSKYSHVYRIVSAARRACDTGRSKSRNEPKPDTMLMYGAIGVRSLRYAAYSHHSSSYFKKKKQSIGKYPARRGGYTNSTKTTNPVGVLFCALEKEYSAVALLRRLAWPTPSRVPSSSSTRPINWQECHNDAVTSKYVCTANPPPQRDTVERLLLYTSLRNGFERLEIALKRIFKCRDRQAGQCLLVSKAAHQTRSISNTVCDLIVSLVQ